MRSEPLFVSAIWGVLCYACPATLAQDTGPYDEEMQRWRAEEQDHLERLLRINFADGNMGIRIPDAVLLKHPDRTLHVLEQYQKSPSRSVRTGASAFAWRMGVATQDRKIRQRVVEQLVKGCFDPESGQAEARWLLDFGDQDFTLDASQRLADGVMKESIRDDLLLVVGVAKIIPMDKWLKSISDKHFYAVLALARFGDDDAARRAVQRVEKVENIRDRVWRWLDMLGYTRHAIPLEYIAGYLDNEEGEVTQAEGRDYYAPPYNKIALNVIAKHFSDCPVKKRDVISRYSQDDFAKVREWLKQRGAQADK